MGLSDSRAAGCVLMMLLLDVVFPPKIPSTEKETDEPTCTGLLLVISASLFSLLSLSCFLVAIIESILNEMPSLDGLALVWVLGLIVAVEGLVVLSLVLLPLGLTGPGDCVVVLPGLLNAELLLVCKVVGTIVMVDYLSLSTDCPFVLISHC